MSSEGGWPKHSPAPGARPREGAVSSHHCDAEPLEGRQHSGAIQPWTPAGTTHNHSNRPWHSPQTGVPALVYDSNMTKCGDVTQKARGATDARQDAVVVSRDPKHGTLHVQRAHRRRLHNTICDDGYDDTVRGTRTLGRLRTSPCEGTHGIQTIPTRTPRAHLTFAQPHSVPPTA